MKFSCEQCSAKYTIPDERVLGKRLKIRCKKCGAIITVQGPLSGIVQAAHPLTGQREAATGEYHAVSKVLEAFPLTGALPQAPQEAHVPAPKPPPQVEKPRPPVEWFYSKGGKQIGPVSSSEVKELIWSRVIGPKTFVWCDGMEDWARLSTVSDFAQELSSVGEEIEKKATDAGVFDSLLKDVGHTPAAGTAHATLFEIPAVQPSEKAAPVGEPSNLAQAAEVVEEVSRAHTAAKLEELPFGAVESGLPGASESADFEVAVREEMERQARELAQRAEAEPTVRTQSYLPVQVVEAGAKIEPTGQPENTRVVILKAGLSARNRMKRFAFAAVITAAILAGITWLATSQKSLTFIKTIAQKVTKPEYSTPASPDEANMTPEEREHFRKALLGIEEKKKEEAVRRRTQKAGQQLAKIGDPTTVDPRLKDAYQGIAKDGNFAPARIDLPGSMEPGAGIGGIGTSVGGTANLDLGRQDARAEYKPDAMITSSRYSTDQVNKLISGNQRKLRYCSEKYVKPGSDLSGKVQLRADVRNTGEVVRVKSLTERIKGTMVEECLIKEIKTWQFPRFEGEPTSVDMTLILTAAM